MRGMQLGMVDTAARAAHGADAMAIHLRPRRQQVHSPDAVLQPTDQKRPFSLRSQMESESSGSLTHTQREGVETSVSQAWRPM